MIMTIIMTIVLVAAAYFSWKDLRLDKKLGCKCYSCRKRKKELTGSFQELCYDCTRESKLSRKQALLDILNYE